MMSGDEKNLKVGVRQGMGPEPGYEWSVGLMNFVVEEAMGILNPAGYQHMAMQVRELARQADPSHSPTVDVKPIEEFYEISDKGGVYGGANVRLFFGVDKTARVLIPLGAIKKQNNGQTPQGDKIRMRSRWRKYLAGEYGALPPLE